MAAAASTGPHEELMGQLVEQEAQHGDPLQNLKKRIQKLYREASNARALGKCNVQEHMVVPKCGKFTVPSLGVKWHVENRTLANVARDLLLLGFSEAELNTEDSEPLFPVVGEVAQLGGALASMPQQGASLNPLLSESDFSAEAIGLPDSPTCLQENNTELTYPSSSNTTDPFDVDDLISSPSMGVN